MQLKEIELIGFKSFADKTRLHFAPGITGIVGPNGCGKSNISDAFRWVFGEQSAKSMRGSKMPDVIFAGTTTRKSLNFCEVTITFSDIQGALPVEYEEVAITRRLHRSGESEYFINRHPVRLKDIQSLFLDSGMGKDAYSIFEQGKIDQIINYSPLERRYIFEEAAGILRFLHRKREALRRLEQADLNTSRIKDIHKEVETQIAVLQRQAEEARQYKEKQDRLVAVEKGLLLARWENVQQRRGDCQKKETEIQKAIEDQKRRLEALKEEFQSAKALLVEKEKKLRQRSEEVFKTRSDKEIKNRERLSHQERMREAMAKEKRWTQELEAMIARRIARQEEIKTLQQQQKGFEADLARYEEVLKGLRGAFQKRESEVAILRNRHQAAQTEHFKSAQKENQLGSELKQVSMRLETAQEQHKQAQEREQKLSHQVKELQQNALEKQKLLEDISEEVDRLKDQFQTQEQQVQEMAEALQMEQAKLEELVRERADSRARQKVLLRLREEKEGFSAAGKRLLLEAAKPGSPLHQKLQPLFELLSFADEMAIPALLRPYSQTLVVKTWADFDQVVAFAKDQQLKDYTLLCLEGLSQHPNKPKKLPEGLQPIPEASGDALARHFFSALYKAEKRADALAWVASHAESEIWLKEGALVDRRQVFFFYSPGESNAFVREAEIKTLDQRLQELDGQCLASEAAVQSLQKERSRKLAERAELDKAVRKAEMRLVEANFAFQRASQDRDRLQADIQKIQGDLQTFVAAIEKFSEARERAEELYAEAKKAALEVQRLKEAAETELEEQLSSMKGEQQDLRERESAFHKISDDNRRCLHALHVHEVKDLESVQQEKRLDEEIRASSEFQNQMKTKTGEQEHLLAEVEELLAKVTAATAEMEKEVGSQRTSVEDIEGRLQKDYSQLKKREDEQHQVALQLAQTEASQSAFVTELQERHGATFEGLKGEGIAAVKGIEQAERQIRSVKAEIEAAGAINMTAIDECSKHQERYAFLGQQLDDMSLTKKELVEIIAQLDGESRKLFQETFEQIRSNFRKNFALLFQGGEADLQFTDTADVLEAGIEIIARPPAKQMRSIQLLSGGEKCLTAMALLFAVFEVKPSPFCILDEIDAPLDDANVERFVRVVQQFVDRTQFLIITHNKRTMAIADTLFGVSMEEKGVSKILMMEFARQPAPQLV
ncbi:MAG: chromosome segregation protein SMC [Parachlamydia sp.]|nr:chromosome segregation protein SMC [Parachlamydia sp.]